MSRAGAWRPEDWRTADAADLAPLYRLECRRWRESLGWDFEPSCALIESARTAGILPGLLVRARNGRIAGWSFFLRHRAQLQIGALVAESDAARRTLLASTLAAPGAVDADEVSCYLYPQSPSLGRTLEREGFSVEAHHYMARDLPPSPGRQAASWPAGCVLGPFAEGAADDVVDLVARAYAGSREGRCFAPDDSRDEWSHYVGRMLETEACGRYLPAASFALRESGGRPIAAILLTRIGEGIAHLAQVVVDPRWRGRALARQLVLESRAALAEAGFRRVTLLVAEGNRGARHLYQELGFRNVQVFLHATRPAVRAAGAREA